MSDEKPKNTVKNDEAFNLFCRSIANELLKDSVFSADAMTETIKAAIWLNLDLFIEATQERIKYRLYLSQERKQKLIADGKQHSPEYNQHLILHKKLISQVKMLEQSVRDEKRLRNDKLYKKMQAHRVEGHFWLEKLKEHFDGDLTAYYEEINKITAEIKMKD